VKAAPFLLWGHVLLVWALANYTFRDPLADDAPPKKAKWRVRVIARALVAAIVIGVIAPSNMSLAALVLVGATALPFVRVLILSRFCAELEIGVNFAFAIATFAMTRSSAAGVERAWLPIPASESRIGVICIVTALAFFTVHGGTYIVRGLLKKTGTAPMTKEEKIDVVEFNRGRLIGALERLLLLAVVVAGSYEALGFIVAAKGLIRGHELEKDRNLTEYFLIGSLASVLIAVGTGSLARWVLFSYW
jgi:hypothetical protein